MIGIGHMSFSRISGNLGVRAGTSDGFTTVEGWPGVLGSQVVHPRANTH